MEDRRGQRDVKRALAAVFVALSIITARASELPYLGEWSNGRGEALTITEKTIQFAQNSPVPYRDITRATDGASFELQITAPGEVNAFPGKFLGLVLAGESMEMTFYPSHAAYMQAEDAQGFVTWFRDE